MDHDFFGRNIKTDGRACRGRTGDARDSLTRVLLSYIIITDNYKDYAS